MQNKKPFSGAALLAGTALALSTLTAGASGLFSYNSLGSGESVRTGLLEHKCGNKSDTAKMKPMKDGKCGNKSDTTKMKKGKDGKCGEGKCGATKKTSN